jgi:hypothetical protein
MRLPKLVGLLLAIAALLTMAALASTASATVLCKASEETCSTENQYPSGTTVSASLASGTTAKIQSGFETITCTGSSLADENGSGTPLPGALTEMGFSGCTSSLGGSCTTSSSGAPTETSLSSTGGGNGTLKGNTPVFEFTCVGVTCRYSATAFEASLTGGSPASLTASKVALAKQSGSNGLCSAAATLTASYTVSSPNPVFVTNGTVSGGNGTVLCSAPTKYCPVGSRYGEGTTFSGSSSSIEFAGLFGPFVQVKCTSGNLKGSIGAPSGKKVTASVSEWTASGCVKSGGGPACTTSFATSAGTPVFATTSSPNGTFGEALFTVTIVCGGSKCFYTTSAPLAVNGGTSPSIAASELAFALRVGSTLDCASSMTMNGTYALSAPKPLYMEST